MADNLMYVYCIADLPFLPDLVLESTGLKSLVFDNLSVIVKSVSSEEFSEENLKKNFGDLAWIEFHARDHIRIIGEVMKSGAVVPFKFGTIFNTSDSLGDFVRKYADSIHENLDSIREKEEWSVKIYCDKSGLNQKIGTISEEVRTLETEISKSMPGKAFLLKRKKVELIGTEVEKVMRTCGQSLYDELVALCERVKINNVLAKEVTERTDEMILNLSCLLNREKVPELLKVVEESEEKYKHASFVIDTTGPWPPFSFISIQEK